MVMHLEKRGLDMQSRKDRKYTILVSGASGIVGYGILRSLRARNDCFLIGRDCPKDGRFPVLGFFKKINYSAFC